MRIHHRNCFVLRSRVWLPISGVASTVRASVRMATNVGVLLFDRILLVDRLYLLRRAILPDPHIRAIDVARLLAGNSHDANADNSVNVHACNSHSS